MVLLTETWLNSGFHDDELFDQSYNVVRRDRNAEDRRGGGVLIGLLKRNSI